MDKELLVFDLDGTLVDSGGDIAWASNRTLEAFGYSEEPTESIKEKIGWGVKVLLERLMPEEGPERIEEARLRFLEFYGAHMVEETYPYPGVRETLAHFSAAGKRMAVVTNKPKALADGVLRELGLGPIFEMVVGGDTCQNKKPHPEPLEFVLKGLGVRRARALFVGDSAIDAETGLAAGVFTVGVSYGFGGGGAAVREAGFDLVIDGFGELRGLID